MLEYFNLHLLSVLGHKIGSNCNSSIIKLYFDSSSYLEKAGVLEPEDHGCTSTDAGHVILKGKFYTGKISSSWRYYF